MNSAYIQLNARSHIILYVPKDEDTNDYTCITAANIFFSLNSFTDSCAHTACKSRKGENLDYICFIPN